MNLWPSFSSLCLAFLPTSKTAAQILLLFLVPPFPPSRLLLTSAGATRCTVCTPCLCILIFLVTNLHCSYVLRVHQWRSCDWRCAPLHLTLRPARCFTCVIQWEHLAHYPGMSSSAEHEASGPRRSPPHSLHLLSFLIPSRLFFHFFFTYFLPGTLRPGEALMSSAFPEGLQ